MSFRIQNNIAAMTSLRYLNKNEGMMNQALERLSSGYRINTAADDAAGLASSMRFRAEVSSLKVASRNASEATSLLQVAEGAMSQIDLILNRMKELSTQAASGNAGSDLSTIDAEAQALISEIDRIVNFTEYGGNKLVDGSYGTVGVSSTSAPVLFTTTNGVTSVDVSSADKLTVYQVSAISNAANTITLKNNTTNVTQQLSYSTTLSGYASEVLNFSSLGVKLTVNSLFATNEANITTDAKITTSDLGDANFQVGNKNDANSRLSFTLDDVDATALGVNSVSLATMGGAQSALTLIDTAISTLAGERGDIGALVNRFTYAQSNLAVAIENKSASESVIRDVDMASEMSEFTKNQILVQASTSMLSQANVAPQQVLSLLR